MARTSKRRKIRAPGRDDQDNHQAEQFDPAMDALQANSVKETIERLGLTFKSAIEQAGVSHSAGYQWITQAANATMSHPSIRAAARKMIEWHTTAEKDNEDAASVKYTIQRLGLTHSAVSAKANIRSSNLSKWLNRKELANPETREAAAALVIWNKTASQRPTPEFDEEQDSQDAAAVKATIQRLGLSVKQVAEQATVDVLGAKQWLSRSSYIKLKEESARVAGHGLVLWNESVKSRHSMCVESPPAVNAIVSDIQACVPKSELLRQDRLSKFKGEIQAVRADDTTNPLVQQLAALYVSNGNQILFKNLQNAQVTFIVLLKDGHQIKYFDKSMCPDGKPHQGPEVETKSCDDCQLQVISSIGVSLVQTPNSHEASPHAATCILLCAWMTADPWMWCPCEERLISVLRQLRSQHAPNMRIFRAKWSESCLTSDSSRVVWDDPDCDSPFGSLCYQESSEWTDVPLSDRDKIGNVDSLLTAFNNAVATVDPSLLGCMKKPEKSAVQVASKSKACMEQAKGKACMEQAKGKARMEQAKGKARMEQAKGKACMEQAKGKACVEQAKGKACVEQAKGKACVAQLQDIELVDMLLSSQKVTQETAISKIQKMSVQQLAPIVTQLGEKFSNPQLTPDTYIQINKAASQLQTSILPAYRSELPLVSELRTTLRQIGITSSRLANGAACNKTEVQPKDQNCPPEGAPQYSNCVTTFVAPDQIGNAAAQRIPSLGGAHIPAPNLITHPVKNGHSIAGFDTITSHPPLPNSHTASYSGLTCYSHQPTSGMPSYAQYVQPVAGGHPHEMSNSEEFSQHPSSSAAAGSPLSAISGYCPLPDRLSSPTISSYPNSAAGAAPVVLYNRYMKKMYNPATTATGLPPYSMDFLRSDMTYPAHTGMHPPTLGMWSTHRRKAAALLAGTAYTSGHSAKSPTQEQGGLAGYPGQTAAGLLSLQSASIGSCEQPGQLPAADCLPGQIGTDSHHDQPGVSSGVGEVKQYDAATGLAEDSKVAEGSREATSTAAQHSIPTCSNGYNSQATELKPVGLPAAPVGLPAAPVGLPAASGYCSSFQSASGIASSVNGSVYKPPTALAKDHMLICADGVSRLWSVLSEMQPGEHISEQTTTMLGDCGIKLVAMLDENYDAVGCDPGSSLAALPGHWTVRSLAAMSIAKLLWLKGQVQGQSSFIYDHMIRAQPLEHLTEQLRLLLQLPVNVNHSHKLLVINRQYGGMLVLHSLLCNGCDSFAMGKAVCPALVDVLASYISEKVDTILPAQLLCIMELLNLLSKEARNACLMQQLDLLSMIQKCEAISLVCKLDKQKDRWDECLMQIAQRIQKCDASQEKESNKSELSKSSAVPEQIDVTCNGVFGKFIITADDQQLVQTKDGKLLTPCAFEIQAGSRSKNWKITIKRVDTGESVYSWLQGLLASHPNKEPLSAQTPNLSNAERGKLVGRSKTKVMHCDVCSMTAEVDEEGAEEWVTCRKCAVSVHIECYCALPDITDASAWVCDRCAQGARNAICNICVGRTGAMKRVQGVNSVKPIDVVCNGVSGQFCTEQQLVITASGEMLTPSNFEAQAGSRSKNWKTSIRRADDNKCVFESLATAWPWAHVRCTMNAPTEAVVACSKQSIQDQPVKNEKLEMPVIDFDKASELWTKDTRRSGSRIKTASRKIRLQKPRISKSAARNTWLREEQSDTRREAACPSEACPKTAACAVTYNFPLVGEDVWVNFTDRWLRAKIEGRSGRKNSCLLQLWFYVDGETEELSTKEVAADVWPVMQGAFEIVVHTADDRETLAEISDKLHTDINFLVELNRKRYGHITKSSKMVQGSSLLVAIEHENKAQLEAHKQEQKQREQNANQKSLAKEKRKLEAAKHCHKLAEQTAATKVITKAEGPKPAPPGKEKHASNRKQTEHSDIPVPAPPREGKPASKENKQVKDEGARVLDPKNTFHASSHTIMDPCRSQDSEDEIDEQWILDADNLLLDEFVDVCASDKQIMKLWNRFRLESSSMVCDTTLRSHIFEFITQYASVVSGDLRSSFMRHLLTFYEFGLIAPETLQQAADLVQPSQQEKVQRPKRGADNSGDSANDSKRIRPIRRRTRPERGGPDGWMIAC